MSLLTNNCLDANIGVLNDMQLKKVIGKKFIEGFDLTETEENGYKGYDGIDGSALDLHITSEVWELKSTAKLHDNQQVVDLIRKQGGKKINISREPLQRNHIYIIKLKEKLAFDIFDGRHGLYGQASGRSSIGRLDILTRLIIDHVPKYDEVPPDYRGNLFLEVVPLSFNIKIKEGIALNQLRVFVGKPELSRLTHQELNEISPMLYYERGQPVFSSQEVLRANLQPDITISTNPGIIAFEAKDKKQVKEIDLTTKNHEPKLFWKPVLKNKNALGLNMTTDHFYILRSVERMFLSSDVAVTCVAYTENLGELRIHYAGFAHPNFGRQRKDKKVGTPLIFEARCHSFDVTIRDQEQFARIEYFRMSEPTDHPSGYPEQELKLSNYFKDWH